MIEHQTQKIKKSCGLRKKSRERSSRLLHQSQCRSLSKLSPSFASELNSFCILTTPLSVCILSSSQRVLWNPTEFGRTPLEFLHKTCLIRENLHQMRSTYNGAAKALLTLRGERTGIQLKSSRGGFHLGGPDLESETHRQMYNLLSLL